MLSQTNLHTQILKNREAPFAYVAYLFTFALYFKPSSCVRMHLSTELTKLNLNGVRSDIARAPDRRRKKNPIVEQMKIMCFRAKRRGHESVVQCCSELKKHNRLGDSYLDLGQCMLNPSPSPTLKCEKSQL